MKTQRKRRNERKTDYGKRVKLLKSNTPRLVFRKTNRYVNAQYVESREAQDKVLLGINSKKLLEYGWPKEFEGSLKSIPACYLTGFLIGKEILNKKLSTPIIDFGMIRNLHKTKTYAFLKGLIDSGVKIKTNKEKDIFPNEERLKGSHLKKDFSKKFMEVKSKIDKK